MAENIITLYPPPVLSGFIYARLFSVHQVENEFKVLHFADVDGIQEGVTDELKKVQKEEFSAALQKMCDSAKVYKYMAMELILNKNKLCVFDLKNQS
jgi:hypothetical protein